MHQTTSLGKISGEILKEKVRQSHRIIEANKAKDKMEPFQILRD